jgi:hypothetical protein
LESHREGEEVTTANRKGAAFAACMFGAISLYFVWLGASDAPRFQGHAWRGYIGAVLFALFAIKAARVAHHPETYDPDRPSLGYRLALLLEGAGLLLAAVLGFDWLMKRLAGRAGPADELQRSGLWVLAGVAALLLLIVVRASVAVRRGPSRERTHRSSSTIRAKNVE